MTYQQWCAPLCCLASQTPRQCSTSAFASSRESRGLKSPFSSPPQECALLPGSHMHIFHLKANSFTMEAPLSPVSFTIVKLSKSYNLIILIARSTVEINRFPVLVDPSRLSLHRIGARRQLAHLKGEGSELVFSNIQIVVLSSVCVTRQLTNSLKVGTVPFLRSVLNVNTRTSQILIGYHTACTAISPVMLPADPLLLSKGFPGDHVWSVRAHHLVLTSIFLDHFCNVGFQLLYEYISFRHFSTLNEESSLSKGSLTIMNETVPCRGMNYIHGIIYIFTHQLGES